MELGLIDYKVPDAALLSLRAGFLLSLVSLVWSAALLTNFGFALAGPEKLGLVFNDMAARLLQLDMSADPNLISFEAFVRNGRAYAYFGIFPALLRIPAVLAGASSYPMSRLSCLSALWIVTFSTIRLTQTLLAGARRTALSGPIAAAALVGVSFSGPPIYVLASSAIYHEAIFWAAAWAAVFNIIVVRRVVAGADLRTRDYALLALSAGCGLLTRVTCGVMLYTGLALLMLWPVLLGFTAGRARGAMTAFGATLRAAAPALLIGAAFIAVQAAVNYGRWGDVLTVAPQKYYQIWSPMHAERVARFERHGGLELARIPISALYYALGLKVDVVFQSFFQDHYDGLEGPRMAGLLCAPWMIVCAGSGVWLTLRHPLRSGLLTPIMVANGIGFLMLLSIFNLAQRYTFDGWSFLALASALGARRIAEHGGTVHDPGGRATPLAGRMAIAATLVGVIFSHATLLRYKINYSGTDPAVRYWLSKQIQPLLCPDAVLAPDVKLTDFNPLVTPNCPPLW